MSFLSFFPFRSCVCSVVIRLFRIFVFVHFKYLYILCTTSSHIYILYFVVKSIFRARSNAKALTAHAHVTTLTSARLTPFINRMVTYIIICCLNSHSLKIDFLLSFFFSSFQLKINTKCIVIGTIYMLSLC